MQLVFIPQEHLGEAWHQIKPFAEKMERRFPDDWPVRTTLEAAWAKHLQIWVVWDEEAKKALGVVATRVIIKASGKKVYDIAWTAGAERKRWMHLLPEIEEFGASLGCEAMEFDARDGWKPDLPDYTAERRTIYRKKLNGTEQNQRAA